MRLSNVDRASDLIEDVLTDSGDDAMVYLSVMVPPAHKKLVEALAKLNRTKQAAVVRVILENWCEDRKSDLEVRQEAAA